MYRNYRHNSTGNKTVLKMLKNSKSSLKNSKTLHFVLRPMWNIRLNFHELIHVIIKVTIFFYRVKVNERNKQPSQWTKLSPLNVRPADDDENGAANVSVKSVTRPGLPPVASAD